MPIRIDATSSGSEIDAFSAAGRWHVRLRLL